MSPPDEPIRVAQPWLPDLAEYAALLEEVWRSRMVSNIGPLCERLEHLASERLGAPAVAVSSCDIGLTLALQTVDLAPGSRVGVSAFTFNSSANAVLWNECRPVFLDIDRDTFCISPASVAEAVERGQIDALLATHTFGVACDAHGLRDALDGRPLVFDAAQAIGTQSSQGPVGALGDVQAFSLSGTKVVTSAEGGFVTTVDAERRRRMRRLRGYGYEHDYRSIERGLNGKLSELHAALGLLTMAHLDEALARRRMLAAAYRERLDACVTFQESPLGRSGGGLFACVFEAPKERARVEGSLADAGVETRRYFLPLHRQPAYARFSNGPVPVAEWLHERILCLPMHEFVEDRDVDLICALVRRR